MGGCARLDRGLAVSSSLGRSFWRRTLLPRAAKALSQAKHPAPHFRPPQGLTANAKAVAGQIPLPGVPTVATGTYK